MITPAWFSSATKPLGYRAAPGCPPIKPGVAPFSCLVLLRHRPVVAAVAGTGPKASLEINILVVFGFDGGRSGNPCERTLKLPASGERPYGRTHHASPCQDACLTPVRSGLTHRKSKKMGVHSGDWGRCWIEEFCWGACTRETIGRRSDRLGSLPTVYG